MRVLAALSGGVDSAVAASRAVAAGHDVTAVHLALSRHPQSYRTGARGCCTLEDARDARRAADVLGIPFYVWDLAAEFAEDVVDDFVAEYAAGRTPNPCLRCNEKVKFSAVLDRARALGFDAVCTGHYARIVDGPDGRELHRAVDPGKDQSYVLGVLTVEQLAGAMFPLGDTLKTDVRHEAAARGLAVAEKPDSHDIVDAEGTVVGSHEGTYGFTVGQRKGMRIDRPAADGKPRYVLDISPVDRRVTVGSREDLAVAGLEGVRPRWCGPVPEAAVDCLVQVRAHGDATAATAWLDGDGLLVVDLVEPILGVAPGQAAVLYDGTRVLGSATIDRTVPAVVATPSTVS